jgi:hypothetical protein
VSSALEDAAPREREESVESVESEESGQDEENGETRGGPRPSVKGVGNKFPRGMGGGKASGGNKFGVMGGGRDVDEESEEDDDAEDEEEDDALKNGDEESDKMETEDEGEGDARVNNADVLGSRGTPGGAPVVALTYVSSFNKPDRQTGEWTCMEPIIEDGVAMLCGKCFPAGRQQAANITNHMAKSHFKAVLRLEGAKRKRKKSDKPSKTTASAGMPSARPKKPAQAAQAFSGSEDGTVATGSSRSSLLEALRENKALKKRVMELQASKDANLAIAIHVGKQLLGTSCVAACHAACD